MTSSQRPRRDDDRQGRRAAAPVGRQRGDHPAVAVARHRPALDPPRARLLLRPARPQGPLQAGLPRCRMGRHPAGDRRADVHDPVQPPGRRRDRRAVVLRVRAARQRGVGVLLVDAAGGHQQPALQRRAADEGRLPAHRRPDGDVPARVHRPRGRRRAGVRHRPRVRRRVDTARARPRAAGRRRPAGAVRRRARVPAQRGGGEVPRRQHARRLRRAAAAVRHARSPSRPTSCPPSGAPCCTSTRSAAPSGCCAGRSSTPPSRPPRSWRRRWPPPWSSLFFGLFHFRRREREFADII